MMNRLMSAGFYPPPSSTACLPPVSIEQASALLESRSPATPSAGPGGKPFPPPPQGSILDLAARHAAAAAAAGQHPGGQLPPAFFSSTAYHPALFAAAAAAAAGQFNPYSGAAEGYPGGMDFNMITRRKNATRETTSALKAWLNDHKKNPYPTKGEKIMLAIITKMTLTQVSTWFANARRRLKKENKMTWATNGGGGGGVKDDDLSDDEDDDEDHKILEDEEDTSARESGYEDNDEDSEERRRRSSSVECPSERLHQGSPGSKSESDVLESTCWRGNSSSSSKLHKPLNVHTKQHFPLTCTSPTVLSSSAAAPAAPPSTQSPKDSPCLPPQQPKKHKIWSLADTAMSPPTEKQPQELKIDHHHLRCIPDTLEAGVNLALLHHHHQQRSYLPPQQQHFSAHAFQNALLSFNSGGNLPKSY